ncbi:MAG: CPBP family intramembrane glutamic endopeptidase [Pseudomonadota bacterium]
MSLSDTAAPSDPTTRLPRARLWAEFTALFIGVPILMAVFFGHYPLFGAILALTGVAAMLLAGTPGFRWAELRRLPGRGALLPGLGLVVLTAAACLAVASWLVPERVLEFPRNRPHLWAMVMIAYPFASALPQELIYRPLFFRRYGALFGTPAIACMVNALAFGLGHLFYMNPVTIGLTVLAGWVFALAYLRYGFIAAVLLHAVAGQIVFTSGLGLYFYHGAVGH